MKLLTLLPLLAAVSASAAAAAPSGPQSTQTDTAFAASYAAAHVTNVSATTQRVSCYAPELAVEWKLGPAEGYPDGGMTPCRGRATTGEDLGPYPTQDRANEPLLVKDHSESEIRVDPTDPSHLIGQVKWAVDGEGYNHLLGFYESFDGGATWPSQGHVPGYEGWADNTDPVGAFDPWGNFYSLLLPYQFYYQSSGYKAYDNGSKQTNPALPPGTISVAVRPHGARSARDWITTHGGHLDHVFVAKNANSHNVDKQWIGVDTNPSSPFYGRVYAMWLDLVLNPVYNVLSYADAGPDGTHTDWSAAQRLPSVPGKPWDVYAAPHIAPDGTIWTTINNNPTRHNYEDADLYLIWSIDGGATWQGPLPVALGLKSEQYQNTTFRVGTMNTFQVGNRKLRGFYPLYNAYEDGSTGLVNVYLTASYDGGRSWTAPIRVNDNAGPTEAFQPLVDVAPSGTVAVTFYDRRLPCPTSADAEAAGSGIVFDPGTAASPGTPWGRSNYCVNTAIQFYRPSLAPIGHNLRLSAHTWDPQLSAFHPSCFCDSTTFIGDYFGLAFGSGYAYTTSASTFNGGENPSFHQQQVVARISVP